jgi:hypothetical protein
MRARAGQFRTLKSFSRAVIVEPVLAGFEAVDDRVAGARVMLCRMLVWRTIAAADVAAFGASAQMQPPPVRFQAFDATGTAWFGVQIDSFAFALHAADPAAPGRVLSATCSLPRCAALLWVIVSSY